MLIKHSKIRWMMADPNAKKLFRYLFAGSRNGVNSIAMIKLLIQQPYNINQLADVIKTDNKVVRYHIIY